MIIRPFEDRDIGQLLQLMQGLAVVEGYADDFRVTAAALREHGLGPSPVFHALVADMGADMGTDMGETLGGMAVSYLIPWTYTLRPRLVLKELFVAAPYRRQGVAAQLFRATQDLGQRLGAEQLLWTVMRGNHRAEAFYRHQGGAPDCKWDNWALPL